MNKVILMGRLTRDPEVRYSAGENALAIARYTLAVDRRFRRDGEASADFINCVIWRKAAESLANYATKGTLIGLTGRIQTRNYENQQGQRIYVTEVVTESFQLLESREVNEQRKEQATGKATFDKQSMDKPDPLDPFSPENSIVDISDNDLPF